MINFSVVQSLIASQRRCRKNLSLAAINRLRRMDDSTLTCLTSDQMAELRQRHPKLPSDYFAHMERFGWGKLINGCMLYSGPIHPNEVYGDSMSGSPILVLGDDTCGYCFGYDPDARTYGELSPDGNWEPWDASCGFSNYISSS